MLTRSSLFLFVDDEDAAAAAGACDDDAVGVHAWMPYESAHQLNDTVLCAAILALGPEHRVPFVHEGRSVGGLASLL